MAFKRKSKGRRRYKKKFSKKRRSMKATVKAIAKSVIMKEAEPKHVSYLHDKKEVYHNAFEASYCNTLNAIMPSQGPSDRQRIGDRVRCTHITIKALIGQKGDRPNVNWRVIVFSVPQGMLPSQAVCFENALGFPVMDDINKDICKVYLDRTFRPNQAGLTGTGNDEYTFMKKWTLRVNKIYKFGPADGAATHNQDPIFCAIIGYDAFGTLLTDNIGYSRVFSDFHFKDI